MRKLLLCAIGAVLAATAAARASGQAADEYPLKYLRVTGTRLAYVEAGRGEPIVFVHGALADYRYWAPQLAAGDDDFHVVAYSRRDFYPNARDSDDALQTPDRDAIDLIELIEGLDTGPVHLVGHSGGGHTALVAAIRRPDLVHSLVLEEGGFVSDRPASMQAQTEVRGIIERARAYGAEGEREAAVRHFIDFVSGPGFFDSVAASIRESMLDNEGTIDLRPPAPLTCAETGTLEVPVLVISGERSPPFIGRQLSGLFECLREAKTATIPGASHGVHYEQPDAFNRLVFNFIAEHRAQAE